MFYTKSTFESEQNKKNGGRRQNHCQNMRTWQNLDREWSSAEESCDLRKVCTIATTPLFSDTLLSFRPFFVVVAKDQTGDGKKHQNYSEPGFFKDVSSGAILASLSCSHLEQEMFSCS